MRHFPSLPEVFGSDELALETLFGTELPPEADIPANGAGLAHVVKGGPFDHSILPPDVSDEIEENHFGVTVGQEHGDFFEMIAEPEAIASSSVLSDFTIDFGGDFSARPKDGPGGGGNDGGGGGGGGGGKGGSGSVFYLSGEDDGLAGFDILLEFEGSGWTDQLMNAFKVAADYLTTVIQDDWDLDGTSEITARREKLVWDDLYLKVALEDIDGTGNVLAQAGPTGFWGSSIGLPAQGSITFDIADFGTGSQYLGIADEIAFHEMMHALGFGTLWGDPSLLNPYGKSLLDVSTGNYTGTWGLAAYNAEFETSGTVVEIEVEGDGGAGTAGGHWDEFKFGTITQTDGDVYDGADELMTGYIDDGAYISYTSVMSLQDLGYDVAYVDYDPSVYVYEGISIDTYGIA
ncbi:leishmanolysin-related zinc metalloendopeptidase [Tropicimonas sp. IMCC6043]|uniref:leishmanolysin-related zinc metalloendopeptidase n=1 Tax=Tropicimonas sp. IMCC6043 TaxID=2510645 RepID=UPI00101D468E|nr:leishmanolysin-related zinc metalloendopeptidase [Tropicimonas sp. IMCC6043]RYH11343.1 hypothetical protein EU800_05640 [Tropicimonas sp. IMCC6043]